MWSWACEKSKSSRRLLQEGVRAGWYKRWCCFLACFTAKAVACSLVGHRGPAGSRDQVPFAHEVLTEERYTVWYWDVHLTVFLVVQKKVLNVVRDVVLWM